MVDIKYHYCIKKKIVFFLRHNKNVFCLFVFAFRSTYFYYIYYIFLLISYKQVQDTYYYCKLYNRDLEEISACSDITTHMH